VKRVKKYDPITGPAQSRKWRRKYPKYYTSYLKAYHKKWRAAKKRKGLCTRCGKDPVIKGTLRCKNCKKYSAHTVSPTIKSIRTEDRPLAIAALEKKNKKCGICGSKKHNGMGWHMDHCHKTKRFRSLLCQNCNLGLGQFKDNIELMKLAIIYLETFKND